jgi:hypothetical protein
MDLSTLLMILSNKQTSASRYSGKVLLAAIMLVFVCIALAVFLGYGIRVAGVSKCDQAEAQLAALNSSKVLKEKPKVGVVKGIAYDATNPCAVVDETIVHLGDKIHNVAVVGIQSNAVEFAKDGVTWQQTVLETPNPAWTSPAHNNNLPAK